MRAGIIDAFDIPGKSDIGKRVEKFCAERELCVGNTYFEHKSLHKSTSVGRSQDGVDVKNMIDLRDLREH